MKAQILISYEAVKEKLKFHKYTFELVGYDFMVIKGQEEAGKQGFVTRLIEANTNPCLEESNDLLKGYLPRMLDDMLKIVMDPLFGSTANREQRFAYHVDGYADDKSMWMLIHQ